MSARIFVAYANSCDVYGVRELSQKEFRRRIAALFDPRIPEFLEESFEFRGVGLADLEPGQDATECGTVISIMEETDIPASADTLEESYECARPLRKLEAEEPLL